MDYCQPSFGTGYARNAGMALYPNLWIGLQGYWSPSMGPTPTPFGSSNTQTIPEWTGRWTAQKALLGNIAPYPNNTQFRCNVTNANGTVASSVATVTGTSVPAITTQPLNQTANVGGTATFTVAVTGSSQTSYQWYQSTNGGATFASIAGATSASYTTGALTTANSGYQYYCVVTSTLGPANSNIAILTVLSSPSFTTQPSPVSLTAPTTATFSVVVYSAFTTTYQWQVSTNGGTSWSNVSTGTGGTTASYTTPATSVSMNGYLYQCVATNPEGTNYSNVVSLSVVNTPTITVQPQDALITNSLTTSFTVASSGTITGYQWQVSLNGGASFANISNSAVYSGATTATLTVTPNSALNGAQYQCIVTNASGNTTSSPATLTVPGSFYIVTQPTTQVIGDNGAFAATFKVVVAGAVASYQWQYSSNAGVTWNNVTAAAPAAGYTGYNAPNLTTVAVSNALNGYLWQCIITSCTGQVLTTNVVELQANSGVPSPFNNPAAVSPTSVTVNAPSTASFTANSSDASSYQWQYSTNNGQTWTNCGAGQGSNFTTTTFTTVATTAAMNGYQYRCNLTNGQGTTASLAATLTVISNPVILQQPVNVVTTTSLYGGPGFAFSVTALGNNTYQWQQCTDGIGTTWTNISGATNNYYFNGYVLAALNGYLYRCVITNAADSRSFINSNAASLTVNANPTVFTVGSLNQQTGSNASVFTVSGVSFFTVPYTFGGTTPAVGMYYTSTNGNTWTVVSVDTVHASVILMGCGPTGVVPTQPATLTGTPNSANTLSYTSAPTQVAPTYTYQWYSHTMAGGSWTSIGGYTSASTPSFVAANDTLYYCVVTDGAGSTSSQIISNTQVAGVPTISVEPISQTVTASASTTVALSVTAGGSPTAYHWYVSSNNGATWATVSTGSGGTTASYTTGNLTTAQNLIFTCLVTNASGATLTIPCYVTVVVNPYLTTQPSASSVITPGSTTTFTVAATTAVVTGYQWQINPGAGVWYNAQTVYNFVVTAQANAAPVVGNTYTNNSITYTILGVNLFNNNTGSVTGTVIATGSGAPTASGTLTNGSNTLTFSSNTVATNATTATVTTCNTDIEMNGWEFNCLVTNAAGTTTSIPAILNVQVIYPFISAQPVSTTATVPSTAAFTVTASGTNTYVWNVSANSGTNWYAASTVYNFTISAQGGSAPVVGNAYTNNGQTFTIMAVSLVAGVGFVTASGTGAPTASGTLTNGGNTLTFTANTVYVTPTTATLTTPATIALMNSFQYQCVVNETASGLSVLSSVATLTTQALPFITTNPSNVTAPGPTTVQFNVSAQQATSYQWQVNTGSGWINLVGANSAIYTTPTVVTAMNGNEYQCLVSNSFGTTTSQIVVLNLGLANTFINNQSSILNTVTVPSTQAFTTTIVGTAPTYLWQMSNNGGASWYSCSTIYYFVITSIVGVIPTIGQICTNGGHNFTVLASTLVTVGNSTTGVLMCQGTSAPAAGPSSLVNGTSSYSYTASATTYATPTAATMTTPVSNLAMNNTIYQCVITSTTTNTSNPFYLTVLNAPYVTTQPASVSVTTDASTTFPAVCSGTSGSTTYLWYVNRNDGNGFVALTTGADAGYTSVTGTSSSPTLSVTATKPSMNGYQYQVVFGVIQNSVQYYTYSNIATLNFVQGTPTIITQPVSTTTFLGQTQAFTVVASGGSTYQWFINNGSGWTPISGATSATYTTPATTLAMSGQQFQCQVIYAACETSVYSSIVTLTVVSYPVFTTNLPLTATYGVGGTPTFTIVVATGATFTYQWYSNNNGAGWVTASGTSTNASYTPSALTSANSGYQYQCVVTIAATGFQNTSNTLSITVQSLPVITTQPVSVTTTGGAAVSLTVASPGNTLQWQYLLPGSVAWVNVSGATSTTLSISNAWLNPYAPNGQGGWCFNSLYSPIGGYNIKLGFPPVANTDWCIAMWVRSWVGPTYNLFSMTTSDGPSICQFTNGGGQLSTQNNGGQILDYNYPTMIPNFMTRGQWTHLVIQRNGNSPSPFLSFWQDGVLLVSGSDCGPMPITTYPILMGITFGGQIGDIAVYGRNLSQAEVAQLASGASPLQAADVSVAASTVAPSYVAATSPNILAGGPNLGASGSITSVTPLKLATTLVPQTISNQWTVFPPALQLVGQVQLQKYNATTFLHTFPTLFLTASLKMPVPQVITLPATQQLVSSLKQPTAKATLQTVKPATFHLNMALEAPGTLVVNPKVFSASTLFLTATLNAPNEGEAFFTTPNGNQVTTLIQSVAATGTLNVQNNPWVTTQPVSVTATASTSVTSAFTVATTAVSPTYLWQVSANNGTNWYNASTIYFANVNSTTGTVPGVGAIYTNNGQTFTVIATPGITNTGTGIYVLTGTGAPSTGSATLTGSGFTGTAVYSATPLVFATPTTVTLTTPASAVGAVLMSGLILSLRCQVTNGAGTTNSNTATWSVQSAPFITTQPPSTVTTTIGASTTINFSVVVSNPTAVTYQWQYSSNGGVTWANITGTQGTNGTTATMTTATLSSATFNQYLYRCQVTANSITVNTNQLLLLLQNAPFITSQPTAYLCTAPGDPTFTVTALGTSVTYQWQVSINGGSSFSNITTGGTPGYTGYTTSSLGITTTATSMNGYLYQCVCSVTGPYTTTSNAAALACVATPILKTQPSPVFVSTGSTTSFSVVASGTVTAYQWQVSTNGGQTFANVSASVPASGFTGYTTATLSVPATLLAWNGYLFRCLVTNASGSTAAAGSIILTPALQNLTGSLFTPSVNSLFVAATLSLGATLFAPSEGIFCTVSPSTLMLGATVFGLNMKLTNGGNRTVMDALHPNPLTLTGTVESPTGYKRDMIFTPSDLPLQLTATIETPEPVTTNIGTLSYGTEIQAAQTNYLIICTNQSPLQYAIVNISTPTNPTYAKKVAPAGGNGVGIEYDALTGNVYIACATGHIVETNAVTLTKSVMTLSPLGSPNCMARIDSLDETYIGTSYGSGEVLSMYEGNAVTIATDMRWLVTVATQIGTAMNTVSGVQFATDIRTQALFNQIIGCDMRFITVNLASATLNPIPRTAFHVYIGGVEATDVQLESIEITHTADEKSQASFVLARKHDKVDYTLAGTYQPVTGQPTVQITINGNEEFGYDTPAYIWDVDTKSETETVKITAYSELPPQDNTDSVTLSIPGINEKLNVYHALVNNPVIDNPYIMADDINPPYYLGILIDNGYTKIQNVTQFKGFSSIGQSQSQKVNYVFGSGDSGVYDIKGNNIYFQPYQNWTYFWFAHATNFITGATWTGLLNNGSSYIGTSPSALTSQTWDVDFIDFWYQRKFPDTTYRGTAGGGGSAIVYPSDFIGVLPGHYDSLLGLTSFAVTNIDATLRNHTPTTISGAQILSYKQSLAVATNPGSSLTTINGISYLVTLEGELIPVPLNMSSNFLDVIDSKFGVRFGSAPYKKVSAKSGVFTPATIWEDAPNGLFYHKEQGWDYTSYVNQVGALELKKMQNINGSVLPKTKCDVEMFIDGYYHFNIALLKRLNIDNTTQANVYNGNNGFPVSVKTIHISAKTMRVTLNCSNAWSRLELLNIDGQMPDPYDSIVPETIVEYSPKFDPNTLQNLQ